MQKWPGGLIFQRIFRHFPGYQNWSLNCHISGRFGSISRHLRGARFKIFSNSKITPKFKLLREEIRYLMHAVGEIDEQFPPKYLSLILEKFVEPWVKIFSAFLKFLLSKIQKMEILLICPLLEPEIHKILKIEKLVYKISLSSNIISRPKSFSFITRHFFWIALSSWTPFLWSIPFYISRDSLKFTTQWCVRSTNSKFTILIQQKAPSQIMMT